MKQRSILLLDHPALEVSELYWKNIGQPAIDQAFPQYRDRIAFGLAGEGSECWGFDDKISMDHDYGPSFCMWLTHDDYVLFGENLQKVYDRLPGEFMGYPKRAVQPMAGKRVGALDMDAFYSKFLRKPEGPDSMIEWLFTPDEYFSAAVNGKVFEDRLGEFTRRRNRLLAYYPDDVRKKKIAARVLAMAQSGQANYPRMMRRGDIVAANDAISRFISAAIGVIYLLNRKYSPYYKWRFRGLYQLSVLRDQIDKIEELAALGSTLDAWDEETILNFTKLNFNDKRAALMEEISLAVSAELRKQGLCKTTESFLEPAAFEVFESIRDPELKSIHILQG